MRGGDGKQITSGFSYWGIGPTIAWANATNDPFYLVMKAGAESFVRHWREVRPHVENGGFHLVSLGVGTGVKDRIILGDLRRQNRDMFYIPVDMSSEMLRMGTLEPVRGARFPMSQVLPVQLDFSLDTPYRGAPGGRGGAAGEHQTAQGRPVLAEHADHTRQVYPRLVVSAVDLALVSGALGLRRDAELVGLLHRWRDTVHLFNRRLDLTEISTFSNTISPAQLEAFHRALHRENSYFAATRDMLENLLTRLPTA